MRVEQEERPVLLREPQERRDERDVLHHVGEVAGVKGVTVLHASPSQSRGRRYSRDERLLRRARLGRLAVLPAHERRQRHQDRFRAPAGLQPEQRAAVVDEVELDVAAAPQQLERALALAERRRAPPLRDRQPGLREGLADRAREREAGLEGRLVEVVEEEPADAARLVAVRQEEIAVAPGLVLLVAARRCRRRPRAPCGASAARPRAPDRTASGRSRRRTTRRARRSPAPR